MIKYSLFLTLFVLFFVSCNKDNQDFDIGSDLVDSYTNIVMVDTFSVKYSTVVFDSLYASSPNNALIGKYSNDNTGTLESMFYFNFDLNENADELITKDDIFDSLTIKLSYSDYYQGDTTLIEEYSLHRLSELLNSKDDNTYMYNTNTFEYDETPLGTYSFKVRPSKDSIEFRIDDALGQEFIDLIVDDSNDVSDDDHFHEYLKGFVLKSNSDNDLILGFDADTAGIKMNLYTHEVTGQPNQSVLSFSLASDVYNFNNISADRSGTAYESLVTQQEELPSIETNNISYIQGGAGVLTRIDFPTLESVFGLEDMLLVKAELILIPSNLNDFDYVPDALIFYNSDKKNNKGDALTYEDSSGNTVSLEASYIPDEPYNLNPYYTIDITDYMLDELSGNLYDSDNGLLVSLTSSNFYNTTDVLLLNGEKSSGTKPKLKLYFLKYDIYED